jgi:hypothetical protein
MKFSFPLTFPLRADSVFCGSLFSDTRLRGRSRFGAAKARHLTPVFKKLIIGQDTS